MGGPNETFRTIEEVLKIISTYGTPFLITAIVLIAIWRGMDFLFKWLEMRNKSLREETDREHEEHELIRMHVSPIVSQKLLALLHRTHAIRAYVFEYHNGNKSFGGLPFLYMTNTYEEVSSGIRSEQSRRQHLSQQMLAPVINALMDEKCIIINKETSDEQYGSYMSRIMVEQDVTLQVAARLVNSHGKLIGHVGLDYGKTPNDTLLEEATKCIRYSAAELGALLSVEKKEG